MLYLYHGTTSVCAIKVRLTLSEKGLPWQGEILHLQRGDQLRPEYLKINPNALVPTLIHDGKLIIESTIIIEYLDETFATPALMPVDPYQRSVARLWMKKIDDYLHATCGTVTHAIAFRQYLLKKTPAELAAHFAAMPDPARRERQRLSVSQGVEALHVAPALRNYDKYIGEMERGAGVVAVSRRRSLFTRRHSGDALRQSGRNAGDGRAVASTAPTGDGLAGAHASASEL